MISQVISGVLRHFFRHGVVDFEVRVEVEHLYMNAANKRTFLVFHTPYIKIMAKNDSFQLTIMLDFARIIIVEEW